MADDALPFGRVAIVGLGLVGGSLARALRRIPDSPRVAASSMSAGDRERALLGGVVDDAVADPAEIVGDADLVVYAAPPDATLELIGAHHTLWDPTATVTDVTSVKRVVIERVRTLDAADRFVGSHPMAGGHGSGFEAARADLFEGARVWLCRAAESADSSTESDDSAHDDDVFAGVAALWRAAGAEPAAIDAGAHDRNVAWSSHLPQLVASALAGVFDVQGTPLDALGPGGLDTTRLAAGAPALWAEILRHNADLLAEPVAAVRRALDDAAAALDAGDVDALERWLDAGRHWREES